MSENHNVQVVRGWDETMVSRKRGYRVAHFHLRDSTANYLLAVEGIERSVNHMIYSPSRDYLRTFGSSATVHDRIRWISRKQVVTFLRSVASKGGPIFSDSNQQRMEAAQHVKRLIFLLTRFSHRSNSVVEENEESGELEAGNSEIEWLGDAITCSKKLKHYTAFCRNETKISLHSIVWISGGGGKHYLGYVEDLYESFQGEKMVCVRRFIFHEDIKNVVPKLCHEPKEIFITSTREQLSAKHIDGVATVLSPSDFRKCDEYLPISLSFNIFMCQKEFKNSRIRSFSLSDLCGYAAQPILSALKYYIPDEENSSEEADDDCGPERIANKTCKRMKILRVDETVSGVDACPKDVAKDNEATKCGPTNQCMKINVGKEGPVENEPQIQILASANENIELLSQDSGMRGCWFRCKILRTSRRLLRVQYCDLTDDDSPEKLLEEWVSARREATADTDRLGMRCRGRLTVRPWPIWDSAAVTVEVGAAVDVWWCDGWWEGVVIGYATPAQTSLQVYFPGENKLMTVERNNIRSSKDWIDNKWVDIMPKHDILSVLTAWLNRVPEQPLLPVADPSANHQTSNPPSPRPA